ncbi:hypothetical protein AB0P17_15450 [Streptomyces sp. NPDC088124]|uniref:hypothetical protein n=1 Tax=Streptomyces sp. NPDC088124 TaxID=3154654 RepID=UPI00342C8EA1
MSETITPAVRELISAVADALRVPRAAQSTDRETYHYLIEDRVVSARVAVEIALDGGCVDWCTQWLRKETTATPVTYAPYVRPDEPAADQDGGADRG